MSPFRIEPIKTPPSNAMETIDQFTKVVIPTIIPVSIPVNATPPKVAPANKPTGSPKVSNNSCIQQSTKSQ